MEISCRHEDLGCLSLMEALMVILFFLQPLADMKSKMNEFGDFEVVKGISFVSSQSLPSLFCLVHGLFSHPPHFHCFPSFL